MTKEQEAIINALEWIMREITELNPGIDQLTPIELLDDVKKAFDPSYETMHERAMESLTSIRKGKQ